MQWDAPESIEELEAPLLRHQQSWQKGTSFTWSIVSSDEDEFIGRISIRQDKGDWSIGYWVHPTQQGQGYATEVARAVVEFGFQVLEAKLITAGHAKWNEPSGKVLLSIGMQLTGETDQGFLKNGKWVSEYEYAISRVQFEAKQV